MYGKIKDILKTELQEIQDAGLYKSERIISSSQDSSIHIISGEEVLNFCSNNYLGLSNNPEVIQAARNDGFAWFWDVICPIYMWDTGHSQAIRKQDF